MLWIRYTTVSLFVLACIEGGVFVWFLVFPKAIPIHAPLSEEVQYQQAIDAALQRGVKALQLEQWTDARDAFQWVLVHAPLHAEAQKQLAFAEVNYEVQLRLQAAKTLLRQGYIPEVIDLVAAVPKDVQYYPWAETIRRHAIAWEGARGPIKKARPGRAMQ